MRGRTVILTVKTQTGVDAFNVPVFTKTEVAISNVLIAPTSEEEVLETYNLYGKKAIYTLGIPKGDGHNWEDTTVQFFGKTWRTIGKPVEGMEELIPLSWNRKVRVESIG